MKHGEHDFELTGGRLCLDFANTVDNRPAANRRDYLAAYSDLVAWSEQTATLTRAEARQLLRKASRRREQAGAALARGRSLREIIYGIFSTLASGAKPAESDLEAFNRALPRMMAESRIVRDKRGFAWKARGGRAGLDGMLWAVTRSAVDLLLSEDLEHIRECAADNCGWLFLDKSKNHRRRWCDMRTCGNRNKIRRYRLRKR